MLPQLLDRASAVFSLSEFHEFDLHLRPARSNRLTPIGIETDYVPAGHRHAGRIVRELRACLVWIVKAERFMRAVPRVVEVPERGQLGRRKPLRELPLLAAGGRLRRPL